MSFCEVFVTVRFLWRRYEGETAVLYTCPPLTHSKFFERSRAASKLVPSARVTRRLPECSRRLLRNEVNSGSFEGNEHFQNNIQTVPDVLKIQSV